MNEGAFLQDLAMLMAVAGSVSLRFTKLKWPKVIGYILAGVMLSRHTWGGSFLADESSVQTIGQLGIVFLMFSMGLELSTSKLKKVSNVVFPTGLLDSVIMICLGFTIGRTCFGWGTVPSLFLGAAISDSATTLLAKVIDEMRWSSRPFVKYVLCTSVCEDIICVGVIALITGVANGAGMNIVEIAKSLGGLGVFFVAVFFFGLALIPRFLTSIAKRGDDEALLLTLLGFCFFVTYLAYRLDYSFALGAFLIGVVGSGSEVRARLASLLEPLRNMFAAVFFVSIGLLVNPSACWENWPAILLLTFVVMGGKLVNCTTGALLTGVDIKTSIQMGFSLAQIGEFAYMVALLYVTTTGDMDKPIYQIVVGASLVTTMLNPMMIRFSDKAGTFVEKNCPLRIKNILNGYRGFLVRYRNSGTCEKRAAVRRSLMEIVMIGVLCFAAAVAASQLSDMDLRKYSVFLETHKKFFLALAVNVVIVTLLALAHLIAKSMANTASEIIVGRGDARWQTSISNMVRFFVEGVFKLLALLELVMINIHIAPDVIWQRCVIWTIVIVAIVFYGRFFVKAGYHVSRQFQAALEVDEKLAKISREVTFSLPEDVIGKVNVSPSSPIIGRSVGSLNIRAETGTTIVTVIRGENRIRNVGPRLEILAGDVLVAMGNDEEIMKLRNFVGGDA
ncbi:MAG: cation:proton antiporter [Kiritimatiellae bacterium]|nr:cation:proton antiporter [Kiritimatiellia bacterium]